MIPRSLGGRLVGAFAALALAIVFVVGGALFVALRGLHQDATLGTLTATAGSVLPQVRDSIGTGELRGTLEEVRTQLAEQNIEVMIVGDDGRLQPIGGVSVGPSIMGADVAVGATVNGMVTLDDTRYQYVATAVRRLRAVAPRGIAFLAVDRSGALPSRISRGPSRS